MASIIPPYVTLTLRNPSPYERQSFIVRDWQPVSKALGVRSRGARVQRVLDDGSLIDLDAQIDRLDPLDRRHDQLVFRLDAKIRGGDEDYLSSSGTVRVSPVQKNSARRGAKYERHYTGVKLLNQKLEFWVNSGANKYRNDDLFYGGAVTSVQLYDQRFYGRSRTIEALDGIESLAGVPHRHPLPEARALQVDRIHLVRPPWDDRRSFNFYPFRQHWKIISVSEGPVRAVATIRSAPFRFRCKTARGGETVFICHVYRSFSLYDDADFIADETWVKARDVSTGRSQRLWFTSRYFMLVQFTDQCVTFRYPDHPGWFALTQPSDPRIGYAFATDAMANAIWNPPLDYQDPGTAYRAFSWDLGTSRTTHCFHQFRCKTDPLEMTHEAGWLWYDLAFKRIRATLEGER